MTTGDENMPSDGCGAWIHRVVLLDLLNKDTPFLVFVRKLVVLCGTVMGVIVAFGFATFLLAVMQGTAGNGTSVGLTFVSMPLTLISTLVPYGYVAKTHETPDWVIALNLFGYTVASFLSGLLLPWYPYATVCATFAVYAAITDVPFRGLLFALLAVLYSLSSWNIAALLTGREPVALPGYQKAEFGLVMFFFAFSLLALSIPVAACVLQMRHQQALLAAAGAANELSRNVAVLLRSYNTDGVSEALEEYAALPHADPELVESYRALVDNLERYRPHLPNWMVGDGSDGGGNSAASMNSASTRRGDDSPTNSTVAERLRRESHAGGSSNATPVSLVGAPYTGILAFAVVDFAAAAGRSFDARCKAVDGFVDLVHAVASSTNSALHSFVGDTVQLSWNAAMRAAQPEVKAVRFMCRIRAALAKPEHEHVVASGAAMSGKASAMFAGTGRVSALAVSLPWHGALLACAAFAKRHGAFVSSSGLSDSVPEAAAHVCRMQPVEQLRVAVGAEEHTVTVHEILDEHDDDNDEWMYVMSKQGADARGHSVHRAFNHCVAGEYAEAIALLATPGDSPTASTIANDDTAAAAAKLSRLGAHLLERAEAALLQRPDRFAGSSCSCHSS
jgi:hypothetical protein